jgi:hypothetical protein
VNREFVDLLSGADPDVADTALTLRELVLAAHPELEERVYQGWRGLGFHHPVAGYVCAIFPRSDRVFLSFEKGVLLADPDQRLVGSGRTVRSLEFTPADAIVGFETYLDAAIEVGR